MIKISIVFHSETGNTRKLAEAISIGMLEIDGIDVKLMHIDNIDNEYLLDSEGVVFGTPTKLGSMSWQMKQWLDTNYTKDQLGGKLAGVFASASYFGQGAETAELMLISHLLIKGMLVYSAGVHGGEPYTDYGVVALKSGSEFEQGRATVFGKRFAEKVADLFCI